MRMLRIGGPALLVLLVATAATGELTVQVLQGLTSSPFLTILLVPLLRMAMFVSGATAVGGVLVGALLRADERVRRIAMRSSLVFAGACALLAVATLADVLAVQWWDALNPTMLWSFLTQIDEGRYLMLQVVLGCTAALLLSRTEDGVEAGVALLALLVAVALPGFTGHSTAALSHWIASATMVAHLLAMNLWVGGVIALIVAPDARTYLRFSPLALAAYVVLVLSGVANLVARIGSWSDFWHDQYAVVLGAKVLLFVVIGVLAAAVRRRLMSADADAPTMTVVRRLITIEGSLMLVAVAFAVTLARLPNP